MTTIQKLFYVSIGISIVWGVNVFASNLDEKRTVVYEAVIIAEEKAGCTVAGRMYDLDCVRKVTDNLATMISLEKKETDDSKLEGRIASTSNTIEITNLFINGI